MLISFRNHQTVNHSALFPATPYSQYYLCIAEAKLGTDGTGYMPYPTYLCCNHLVRLTYTLITWFDNYSIISPFEYLYSRFNMVVHLHLQVSAILFAKPSLARRPSCRRGPAPMISNTVTSTAKLCFHHLRSSIAINESIPMALTLVEMSMSVASRIMN